MAQDDSYFWIKPRLIFSFYLCLRLTSPNYAFMWRRLYGKRKVKLYHIVFFPLKQVNNGQCNTAVWGYIYMYKITITRISSFSCLQRFSSIFESSVRLAERMWNMRHYCLLTKKQIEDIEPTGDKFEDQKVDKALFCQILSCAPPPPLPLRRKLLDPRMSVMLFSEFVDYNKGMSNMLGVSIYWTMEDFWNKATSRPTCG